MRRDDCHDERGIESVDHSKNSQHEITILNWNIKFPGYCDAIRVIPNGGIFSQFKLDNIFCTDCVAKESPTYTIFCDV